MLWWILLEPLSRRAPGGSMPLIFLLTSTAVALVISFSNSQKYGQFAGALCAAVGVAMVLGWWNGKVTLARDGVFAISLVSFALLATGHHFADVSTQNVLLIALAPLLAWIAEAPGIARLTGWKKLALRLVVVAIPLAVAIIPTAVRFKREMETMYVY